MLVHQDQGKQTGGGREHSSRMWLVPYVGGSVVWDASVCLCVCMYLCVWCTWGAESTSEWESTVQGAALLLTKGRPFCFILLMYTVWLNVDITEWGMYSNEYCEGNINLH